MYVFYLYIVFLQVALRRQQSNEDMCSAKDATIRSQTLEALLTQKKVYQRHLRNLQQQQQHQTTAMHYRDTTAHHGKCGNLYIKIHLIFFL